MVVLPAYATEIALEGGLPTSLKTQAVAKLAVPQVTAQLVLVSPRSIIITDQAQALLGQAYPHFEVVWFGHIGDGNLHISVLKPDDVSEQEFVAQCGQVTGLLGQALKAHGGSISAEHGIGLLKKPYLDSTRDPAEVALMRGIRKVFDPNGILNPGKVFDA